MKKKLEEMLRNIFNTFVLPIVRDEQTVSVMAFLPLAAFASWPLFVLFPTLKHCSFDRMVKLNFTLLDKMFFPLVVVLSVEVYVIVLCRAFVAKRAPLQILRKNPALVLFFALVVWMTINIYFTNGITYTLRYGNGLKHENFRLHLEYFLCFFPLGILLHDSRLKLWLLRGMTAVSVCLALSAFYLYNHLVATPYYYDWRPTYAGIFTNINYYGYFLTVFIGLSAALLIGETSRLWQCFYAAALISNTVVLSYNNTMGAWIGSLCACVFLAAAYCIREGRFCARAFVPLGIFLVVMCVTGRLNGNLTYNLSRFSQDVVLVSTVPSSAEASSAGSGRWHIWRSCMELIKTHPLFGIGFEGVVVRNLSYVGNARPHNEFMQYALFYGIPGGLLYIAGCVCVYLRALRLRTRLDAPTLAALTAALGYLAGSFFGLTVYNTAPYFFIMLGLGYAWEGAESHGHDGTTI